jgi:CRISPR/Cas system-associated exonuclease Cas4 (RecB family)
MAQLIQPIHFNQSNLQDYVDCPRRFQYKILDNLAWPAQVSDLPLRYEKLIQDGIRFHSICHQYFSGIDPNLIESTLNDTHLIEMWNNFLPFGKSLSSQTLYSELLLSMPYQDHKLLAKFDLLVQISSDQIMIIDWKTSRQKPSRKILDAKIQTYLYPFILNSVGSNLLMNLVIEPNQIKMKYWFPSVDSHQEIFSYSNDHHSDFTEKLSSIIEEITTLIVSDKPFPMTDNLTTCNFCAYRSLCNRGIKAGDFELLSILEHEDLSNIQFDLENILEIEF